MASDDFIPLTTVADDLPSDTPSADSTTPPSALSTTLAERLKMARVTMEGPERAIARERNEKSDRIHNQIKKLEEDLALITKRKEDLEIAWVVLDNKRNDLKKILAPILADEEKAEVKEDELEGKERTTLLPSERQRIEKERWQAQEERRKIEVKKWELEDKVAFLETQIADNTKKYQELLDQEGTLRTNLDSLDEELNILAEQIKLEEEDKKRRALIEAELHQKEMQEKKKIMEVKTVEPSTTKESSSKPLSNPTPAPVKSREELLREAEDNRRRMQEEIARITGNLNTKAQTSTPLTIPSANSVTPSTPTSSPAAQTAPEINLKPVSPLTTPASSVTNTSITEPIKINVIRQGNTTPTVTEAFPKETNLSATKPTTLSTTPISEPNISTPATASVPTSQPHYREEIAKDDLVMTKKEDPTPLVLSTATEDKLPKVRTMQSDLASLKGQTEK